VDNNDYAIKTVFILGAGASKLAGAPLMSNFLDEAEILWRSRHVGVDDEHFERIFTKIGELQPIYYKSVLDLNNIETIFSIFEIGKLLQRLPGTEGEDVDKHIEDCRKSLVHLIVRTLEAKIRFWFTGIGCSLYSAKPYDDFLYLLQLLTGEDLKYSVSILTFNYDINIDHALFSDNVPFTYALDTKESTSKIPLLKLHGSLNWGKCEYCKDIVPVIINNELLEKVISLSDKNQKTTTLDIGSYLKYEKHNCGRNLMDEPMLVPPLWNKTEYHNELALVWQRAADVLSKAENIFVIGYSFPETDAFFRYLYGLGTVGKFPLKRFWVFNPDESGVVEGRFKALVGSGAFSRFKYLPETFETAVRTLIKELVHPERGKAALIELDRQKG
jgi:hypothetical protein